jgi:hypothetical protein
LSVLLHFTVVYGFTVLASLLGFELVISFVLNLDLVRRHKFLSLFSDACILLSSRSRVLRADGATVAETRENSISEQRIQGLERAMENQVQFPRRRKYLRPGQLAKLVDERKKSRISKEALGIKREAKDLSVRRRGLTIEVENVPTTNLSSPLSRSPVPTIQEWGPAYPQRKKLVAPRTPLTPACQLTVMRTPMREMDVPSQSESPLEGLPVELLVRLISLL